MDIGNQIRKFRVRNGLTQKELASQSGVSINTIAKIEKQMRKQPSTDILKKLSLALHVDVDSLIGPQEEYSVEKYKLLPLDQIGYWGDFENICYEVIKNDFPDKTKFVVQIWAKRDDGGKDISVIEKQNKRIKYVQCKYYKKGISYKTLQEEILKISKDYKEHFSNNYSIEGIEFWTTPDIDNKIKKKIQKFCDEVFGSHVLVVCFGQREISSSLYESQNCSLIPSYIHVLGDEYIAAKLDELSDKKIIPIQDTVEKTYSMLTQRMGLLPDISDLSKEIRNSSLLINSGDILSAKELLLTLLGRGDNNDSTKSKINNNLGICSLIEGDKDKALDYFNNAIVFAPNDTKPLVNKAKTLIYRHAPSDFDTAKDILTKLWNVRAELDTQDLKLVYRNFLEYTYAASGFKDFANLLDTYPEIDEILNGDIEYRLFYSGVLLTEGNYDKAEEAINQVENLDTNPRAVLIKSWIYLLRAQKEDIVEILSLNNPVFSNSQNINEAYKLAKNAIRISDTKVDQLLINEAKSIISLIHYWKRDYDKIPSLIKDINKDKLSPDSERINFLVDVNLNALARKFDIAYQLVKESSSWSKISAYTKYKAIQETFIANGGVEHAKVLLEEYIVNDKKVDASLQIQALLTLSGISALLENRSDAIEYSKRAVDRAKEINNSDLLKLSYRNSAGIAFRYVDKESDRLVDAMSELQNITLDKVIFKPFKFHDEKGGINKDLKNILAYSNKEYLRKRDIFVGNPIPFYILISILQNTLAEFLDRLDDPMYTIESSVGMDLENKVDLSNFEKKVILIDYLSLLDLADNQYLGLLQKSGIKFAITQSLFIKIQEDLAAYENPSLRILWNFLRRSNSLKILEGSTFKKRFNGKSEHYDEWVVDYISYAQSKRGSIYMTQDQRFGRLLKGFNAEYTSVGCFINDLEKKGWLDSKAVQDFKLTILKRHYIFFPFNGELLFTIVSYDRFKITDKSYYLINQIVAPGSVISSFLQPFYDFLIRIWKTGIPIEDKMYWLDLLFNKYFEALDQRGDDILTKNRVDFDDSIKIFLITIAGIRNLSSDSEIKALSDFFSSKKDHRYYKRILEIIIKVLNYDL